LFYGADEFLYGINLFLFKVRLTALPTDPCGNGVECDVTAPTVRMKGGVASFHFALAMDALHFLALTLKSSDHSLESGTYVVIMAK
jgi:hypothetical protein